MFRGVLIVLSLVATSGFATAAQANRIVECQLIRRDFTPQPVAIDLVFDGSGNLTTLIQDVRTMSFPPAELTLIESAPIAKEFAALFENSSVFSVDKHTTTYVFELKEDDYTAKVKLTMPLYVSPLLQAHHFGQYFKGANNETGMLETYLDDLPVLELSGFIGCASEF